MTIRPLKAVAKMSDVKIVTAYLPENGVLTSHHQLSTTAHQSSDVLGVKIIRQPRPSRPRICTPLPQEAPIPDPPSAGMWLQEDHPAR